jgi:bile acid:Na+ symporter, BASS family
MDPKNRKGLRFTAFVLLAVFLSMLHPAPFLQIGGYQLTGLIVPLIQIIMLGMGATLSLSDFTRAFKMPRAVLTGLLLQFAIMPALGFAIAHLFGFPSEIAAGVILVGACPGGVASNVMCYLAKGDVALSVTMTAFSTLAAPLMTPLAMTLLAGAYVPVSFHEMMMSIIKMIILPVAGGLLLNHLLHGRAPWLYRLLPVVSMAGIVVIITIITANSRDQLLSLGPALILAALLHNSSGYLLGYWGARLGRLDERASRTVAIEVGMQNAGMASGLAINVLKSVNAAIAPAIFGPLMNVSGSLLGSWWGARPLPAEK